MTVMYIVVQHLHSWIGCIVTNVAVHTWLWQQHRQGCHHNECYTYACRCPSVLKRLMYVFIFSDISATHDNEKSYIKYWEFHRSVNHYPYQYAPDKEPVSAKQLLGFWFSLLVFLANFLSFKNVFITFRLTGNNMVLRCSHEHIEQNAWICSKLNIPNSLDRNGLMNCNLKHLITRSRFKLV